MSAATVAYGDDFMENLRRLFAECDLDGSGALVKSEFNELCGKIGLSSEVAEETFSRLDSDKNGQVTFEEFAAGFQQYNKQTTPTATGQQQQPIERSPSRSPSASFRSASDSLKLTTPSPVSLRARSRASQGGAPVSLGSTAGTSGSSSNLTASGRSTSSSAGTQFDLSSSYDLNSSYEIAPLQQSMSAGELTNGVLADDVVVYSGDTVAGTPGTNAYNSGQYGSLLSTGSSNYSQVKTMQDLLECVQKLQNENQILTQIFFKDKREREEYISQLGEEFDHQLREVEERANKRAREELENEKKRLRDMMQTERETLQHHYQTLEKISKMVKAAPGNGEASGKHELDEGLFKVKSQLEDTFNENRKLKKSLLDTKTDVALIWKEMEKLKKQYELKLSSAYEKQRETQYECDHIKRQLNLMQDSNRKLQDASDVITNYIADKVEPVIKVALDGASTDEFGSLSGPNLANNRSASNSRRGSILSEYLTNNESGAVHSDKKASSGAGDLESMASSLGGLQHTPATLGNSSSSSQLAQSKTNGLSLAEEFGEDSRTSNSLLQVPQTNQAHANTLSSKSANEDAPQKPTPKQKQKQQQPEHDTKLAECSSVKQQVETTKQQQENANTKGNSLRNLGRHFILGSRTLSESKVGQEGGESGGRAKLVDSKSASADHVQEEPSVGPADGPSVATFNIILVGDSFVGKSSFAARFIEGSFVQGLISNCSIDFKTKSYKVDGINYTVNLWDTAGQERFRSITASYFRKADGIILMYDVTDKRSYLNVRNWMSTISDTAAENVAVLLVGNKIDLRLSENKAKCVPTEEGLRLAKEYDIVFLETSVKTGTNLLPSMGKLIGLIAKNNSPEEEDNDRIRLSDKNRTFNCMPKNC